MLNKFIMYHYPHHLSPEFFSSCKMETLYPLKHSSPFPSLPPAPGNPQFSAPKDLTISSSCKWAHSICFCVWLISLSINIYKVHPCYSMCQNSAFQAELCVYILLYSCVTFCLGSLCVLSVVTNAAVNMGAQVFFQDSAFSSFACVSSSRIAGSYNSIFNFFEEPP